MRAFSMAMILPLLSGCGHTETAEDYCASFFDAVAAHDATCSGLSQDVATEVSTSNKTLICPQLAAYVDGVSVKFYSSEGALCLSRIKSAPCGPAQFTGDNPCAKVFVGQIGGGGDCLEGGECAPGTACGANAYFNDPGRVFFECSAMTCVQMADLGQACTGNAEQGGGSPTLCLPWLECDQGTCASPSGSPVICSGLIEATSLANTCVAGVSLTGARLGEACDATTSCMTGWCNAGTCADYTPLGVPCTSVDYSQGPGGECGPTAMCRKSGVCEAACVGRSLLFDLFGTDW
jgi:hypothetical protein